MQFRLVYEGVLNSNGDARHKQDIRRVLLPQLRELWTHEPLSENRKWLDFPPAGDDLSVIREVGGFRFAPLVCETLKLVVELEIVLLRPMQPGALIRQSGDIDNQLKTLFDALRCPHSLNELPKGDLPQQGEDPFFCLLDDDERITDLHVATDRRLAGPDKRRAHVSLLVRTRASKLIWANLPLA